MANTLAELTVEINTQFDKVQQGFNQVQASAEKTQTGFGVMAGAIGGLAVMAGQMVISSLGQAMETVKQTIIDSIDYAHSVEVLSSALCMTTDQVQKFGYALRLEEVPLNTLETATKFMSKSLLDMEKQSGKNTAEAVNLSNGLSRLGISFASFKTMSVADQLDLVFRKIGEVSNANDRATITTQIFGRGGLALLPVIQTWTDRQGKLNQMLKDFGIPEKDLKDMGNLKTESEAMGIAWQYAGMELTIGLMPAMKELIPIAINLAKNFGDFIKNNPEVVKAFGEIAVAIGKVAEGILTIIGAWYSLPAPLRVILSGGLDSTAGMTVATGNYNKAVKTAGGSGYSGGWAEGGIFTQPTFGMIGEAGPEAVIPLDRLASITPQGGNTTVNISAGAFMGSREDARSFARMIQEVMRNENNTRTYGRLV